MTRIETLAIKSRDNFCFLIKPYLRTHACSHKIYVGLDFQYFARYHVLTKWAIKSYSKYVYLRKQGLENSPKKLNLDNNYLSQRLVVTSKSVAIIVL